LSTTSLSGHAMFERRRQTFEVENGSHGQRWTLNCCCS